MNIVWRDVLKIYTIDLSGYLNIFTHTRHGYKWWPDEQLSPQIRENVEKQLSENKIDVVFSHTCSAKYIPTECFLSGIDQSRVDNSTEEWLDTIEDKSQRVRPLALVLMPYYLLLFFFLSSHLQIL